MKRDDEKIDMLPVMTTRQIRNAQLRMMGIKPHDSYRTAGIGPGDEVEIEEVHAKPFAAVRWTAVVSEVFDRGHHILAKVQQEGKEPRVVLLHREGPPDWGVIEFRVVKKVWHQRQPDNADKQLESVYQSLWSEQSTEGTEPC